jgi:hypothetical protein
VDELDGMNSAPAFATADDAHAHDLDFLESADLLVRARRADLESAGFAHTRAAPLLTKRSIYITDYRKEIGKLVTSITKSIT